MKTCYPVLLTVLLPFLAYSQGRINASWPQFPSADLVILRLADPCNPEGARTPAEGSGYSAELWYSGASQVPESGLIALPGSQAPLGREGHILFSILAPLHGHFGGDQVSLQVRVWDNIGGTIGNWSEVLQHPGVARGVSRVLGDYQLAGVGRDGAANVGSGSIQALRGPITLSAACPEPAGWLLLGVAAGLAFLGANRSVAKVRYGRRF